MKARNEITKAEKMLINYRFQQCEKPLDIAIALRRSLPTICKNINTNIPGFYEKISLDKWLPIPTGKYFYEFFAQAESGHTLYKIVFNEFYNQYKKINL